MKMIKFEIKKFLIFPIFIFLAIVLVLKYMNYLYMPKTQYNFSIEIYNDYINTLNTLSFEEQKEWIETEMQHLTDILSKKDEMTSAYTSEKITLDQFSDYQTEYMKAEAKKPAFDEIKQKYEYYTSLENKGIKTEFFNDLTVRDYINYLAKANYFFIAFVIFTVVQMLSADKENKMDEMVLTSPNGRLHRYKIIAIFIFIFLTFLTTVAVDIILYFRDNSIELLNYKVCNIEIFRECGAWITIKNYIFFTLLLKLFWSIMLGYFVYLIYALTDNKIVNLVIDVAFIYISLMLKNVLGDAVSQCFIGSQLCGDVVLHSTVNTSMIVFMIYVILITAVLILLRK